jgi:hypothetical protein
MVQFAIEWQANYQIEGERFIVIERTGQMRAIVGYPLRALNQFIRRAMRHR